MTRRAPAWLAVALAFVLGVGLPTQAAAEAMAPTSLVAIAPARILDTRTGTKPVAGSTTHLAVTGVGGVPAGATAVVINLTAVTPDRAGYAQAWPAGEARPSTSNVNYDEGKTVANQAIVKVGANGQIDLFTYSSAHLLVDVTGYYFAGATYTALTPARVLDSRGGAQPAAQSTTAVTVLGRGGVPSTGVAAVVVNVTAVSPPGAGYAQAWPAGEARPTTSTLNYTTGQTVAGMAIVKVGPNGQIDLFTYKSAHLLVDVMGWIPTNSDYVALSPSRVVDTRTSLGAVRLPAGGSASVQIAGRGGVPATGVKAVEINLTAVNPARDGNLAAYPAGGAAPSTSVVNYETGQSVANSATLKLSASGQLTITSSAAADFLVDISGYWKAAPVVSTTSLASATVGQAYSAALTATGGAAPVTWAASGLPAGLTLNATTGTITGTPTATGTSSVTVTAVDAAGQRTSRVLSLAVAAAPVVAVAPSISTTTLRYGTQAGAYSSPLAATGGATPYTWSATGLPAGLTINASTGTISGTPSVQTVQNVTVTVEGANGASSSKTLSIDLGPSMALAGSIMATEVNSYRTKLGLAALAHDTRIDAVAAANTSLEVRKDSVGHFNTANWTSLQALGYRAMAENAASGIPMETSSMTVAQNMVKMWVGEPNSYKEYVAAGSPSAMYSASGHRINIENPAMTAMGYSVMRNPNTGWYYSTMDFGGK